MNIFPESYSSESSDSKSPESPEIALMSDVSDEATPKTSQSYSMPLQPFIANTGLITTFRTLRFFFV